MDHQRLDREPWAALRTLFSPVRIIPGLLYRSCPIQPVTADLKTPLVPVASPEHIEKGES
jgi:hypothetical protein